MADIYKDAFEKVPVDWLEDILKDVISGEFGGRSLDDKRVFARWLRGFHASYFRANSVALSWLTCPCEKFGRGTQVFLSNYVKRSWSWITDAVPSLPDFPSPSWAADKSRFGAPVASTQTPLL